MKAFLLLLLICSHSLSIAANDKGKELQQLQQLQQLQGGIKTLTTDQLQLKKRQDTASAELKRIEQQYGELAASLSALNTQVQAKQKRIADIQQEIALQNGWLLGQQEKLAELVTSAHALGQQEQLKLLFNQQDGRRTSRMLTYYQYFNRQRLEQLAHIKNSLQLLKMLHQDHQTEQQTLAELVSNKQQQQTQLAKNKQERQALLLKINSDYQSNSEQLARLKKNEQQLKRLIVALQKTAEKQIARKKQRAFPNLKGKLPWPVKGRIVRSFGSARASGKWSGVVIKAKQGTKVKAIAAGKVVFADWLKGFGLLVIVAHDKQYMSLYAFNESLYKSQGDVINQGDTLATVGSSGGRNKPGLYFEIRKKTKAVNPKRWCKRR